MNPETKLEQLEYFAEYFIEYAEQSWSMLIPLTRTVRGSNKTYTSRMVIAL